MRGRGFFSLPVQSTVHLGGEARATGAGRTGHLAPTVKKQSNGCRLLLSSLFPSTRPRIPAREMALPSLRRFLPVQRPTSQVTLDFCQAAADTNHPSLAFVTTDEHLAKDPRTPRPPAVCCVTNQAEHLEKPANYLSL